MKKSLLLISASIVIFTTSGFIISSNGIAGQTGSPGEGTCASCHSGGTGPTTVSINATPAFTGNQYLPGQTYTISVDVANANFGEFGFGCEILSSSNANAGLIQNGGAGVIFANSSGRKNAIHSAPKTGTGSASFTFEWVAPTSGNATIYAAGNAVNGNNNTLGDAPGNTSLALTALTTNVTENADITNVSIFPNPSHEEISIQLNLKNQSDIKISVYDLSGKEISLLSHETYSAGNHKLNYKLDQQINSGVYIIKLQLDGALKTQKLIIKK